MKLAILALAVVVLTACNVDTEGSPQVALTPDGSDLSREVDFKPYPGVAWYGPDGQEISQEANIINAITGPDHCEWQSGVMMHVGWPLGHDASDVSESRQYFRDPEKVFPQDGLLASYASEVKLPKRAKSSGYRTDFMELWFVPGDDAAAYLVFKDHVERWPRSKEVIACA